MVPTEAMAAAVAEVATEVRAAMEEMVAMGSGVVFMSLVDVRVLASSIDTNLAVGGKGGKRKTAATAATGILVAMPELGAAAVRVAWRAMPLRLGGARFRRRQGWGRQGRRQRGRRRRRR